MKTIQMLIADDEQLELDALELMVSETGYTISCLKAKNGNEAIELARKYRPHILLLDIQMPGINGLEAAETIRQFLPTGIIIFLTAWGRFDFAQKAIHVGAAEYLVKPVDKEKIKNVLDMYIRQLSPNESDKEPDKETTAYDSIKIQHTLSSLQDAILAGNKKEAVSLEQQLIDAIYELYGHTEKAQHELYESYLILTYGVCKAVPFLYQEKPEQDDAVLLESTLAQFTQKACDAVCEDRKDKYKRIFAIITHYIDNHFMEQLSVDSVANQFDLHPAYFTRLFHEYCGKTFVDYVTCARMKFALKELSDGKPVKETAAACGFSDTNYFSRVFRKCYGKSPVEFTSK